MSVGSGPNLLELCSDQDALTKPDVDSLGRLVSLIIVFGLFSQNQMVPLVIVQSAVAIDVRALPFLRAPTQTVPHESPAWALE